MGWSAFTKRNCQLLSPFPPFSLFSLYLLLFSFPEILPPPKKVWPNQGGSPNLSLLGGKLPLLTLLTLLTLLRMGVLPHTLAKRLAMDFVGSHVIDLKEPPAESSPYPLTQQGVVSWVGRVCTPPRNTRKINWGSCIILVPIFLGCVYRYCGRATHLVFLVSNSRWIINFSNFRCFLSVFGWPAGLTLPFP